MSTFWTGMISGIACYILAAVSFGTTQYARGVADGVGQERASNEWVTDKMRQMGFEWRGVRWCETPRSSSE